jgi:hypothetical protein
LAAQSPANAVLGVDGYENVSRHQATLLQNAD